MRNRAGLAAVLVSVLAIGGAAFAAEKHATATTTKTAKAEHAMTGQLSKADASSVTLKTSKGEETFMVSSATKVHAGSKAVAPTELANHVGQNVKVHYTEADGQRTATSVAVSGSTHASASKSGTSKKPAQ